MSKNSSLNRDLIQPQTPLLQATPEQLQEWHDILLRDTGIDMRKIYHNVSPAVLYEKALKYEEGSAITSSGALVTSSGSKTGRSPKDKRIVIEDASKNDIWWGSVNIPMDEHVFMINRERAVDYLNTRPRLFIFDGFAGWDTRYRIKVRVICARAYHALFMHNMLIRPTQEELVAFGSPDFTILNAGDFPANKYTSGMSSNTSVAISFKHREMVILGTLYAGEMKKGIFSVMHYLMPKRGVLSLHASTNEGINEKRDVTVFFGLSGTGKTTLSADPARNLIGDDETCWSDDGVFNVEGGCYAKCINLQREKELEIWDAIRFGSVLENVVYDNATRQVNFADCTLTENTRCAFPIEHIAKAKIPCIGAHPKNIILLTCDAFGVLPPVSKLTKMQAMYHFISGYTAKIAGTEDGIKEPTATFSTCFGEPFIVWHPMKYAAMLRDKIETHSVDVWLINTGWIGGGYGEGRRIPLQYSRAIIDAIHTGELKTATLTLYDVFNLHIPSKCSGIPDHLLDPAKCWQDAAAFRDTRAKLARLFVENFKKYADNASAEVQAAGPTSQ